MAKTSTANFTRKYGKADDKEDRLERKAGKIPTASEERREDMKKKGKTK
jgi:hypothetical protein